MKNNILFWIIFTVSCNGLSKYNILNSNNKYNNILHKNDEIAKLCFNELYNATLENVNQRMVHLADNPNDLNPEMQLSFDAYHKNKEAYLYIRTGLDLLSMHYNGNTEVHKLIAQIAFHAFKTMLHYADNVQIEQLEFPIVRPVLREDQHTLFEAHASNSHNRLFDVRLFDVRDHDSLFGWMIQFCDVETLKFLVNNQDKLCEVYGKERIYSVDMLSCMLCRYVADRIHKRSMHEETQMCALIIELMHSIPYADYAQHLQQELAEHKYQDKILLTTLQDIVERYREIPRDQRGVREPNIEIKHTTETINKLLEIFSRLHRQNANLFTNKIKHIVVNIVENGNVHMVKTALSLPKKRYRSTEIHKFLEIAKNKAAALKEGEKEVSSKQEKATRSQKDLEATIKFLSLEEEIAKNREELKEKLGSGYKWFKIAGINIERSFYNMNHEAELKAILDETARLCNQSMEPSLVPDIKQEKTFFETYF